MRIEYDQQKRDATLDVRGLDMAEAAGVFAGSHVTFDDLRCDYGERRHITVGYLHDCMVVIVWTRRGTACRVISLRKANERERRSYHHLLSG